MDVSCLWPLLPGSPGHQMHMYHLTASQGLLPPSLMTEGRLSQGLEEIMYMEKPGAASHLMAVTKTHSAPHSRAPGLATQVEVGMGGFMADERRDAQILCSQEDTEGCLYYHLA